MTFWYIISFLGIVLTATQLLPQIIKSLRTGQVHDVSIGLGIIVACNAMVWILYGWHYNDFAVITANVFNLVFAIILLILKIKSFFSLHDAKINSRST